jgi:deazaflavin-dependent oxidoreductase (nitroreductase family)
VPVFFVRDGDRVVAACENFGLRATSSWPGNLEAHPHARIQIGSRVGEYRARPATQDEYDRNMPRLLADWPAHETYRERTGVRQVVVFEPVS